MVSRFMGLVLAFATAMLALLPLQAQAAYVFTDLSYDPGNYRMSGYTLTRLGIDEAFPTDFFYDPCECWIKQSNYAGVSGVLRTPANQVAQSTPILWNLVEAYIGMAPFRAWQAGTWTGQGTHYLDSRYAYASDPFNIMFVQTTPLGTSQDSQNIDCAVPESELTLPQGWRDADNQPTIYDFRMRLLPLAGNFAGARITEDQTVIGSDGCYHHTMAPMLPFDSVSGGNWGIVAGNYSDSYDAVGVDPAGIEIYRNARSQNGLPMPCTIILPQHMKLTSCPGDWRGYKEHNLRIVIDTTSVYVERDGVGIGRSWDPGVAPTPGGGDTLSTWERLYAGDQRSSANSQYTLVYQTDGNLVLYGPVGPIWATMTFGAPGYVEMQGDGNLVIYNASSSPVWSSGSSGSGGSYLAVQDDGNLVIYTDFAIPVWAR